MINSAYASDITQTDLISYRSQIQSNEEDLFFVWTELSETNSEIYFSKSNDNGLTFSDPINLSNNLGASAFPRIAISENNIFVIWYDYSPGQSDVFFAKSSDNGETFSKYNLSDNISASYNPWIEANSNFVYIVWNDGGLSQEIEIDGKTRIVDVLFGNSEIFFGFSENEGQTFDIKNISNMPGESIDPRMRIDENKVYLVWTDKGKNSEIFFSKSTDSGRSFSDPINISKSDHQSKDSGIFVHENNIFLIWKEKIKKNTEIYFSKSNDGGNSFNTPISISGNYSNFEITRDTQIDVSFPHLFIVYYDENYGVHLKHSPDMGETFFDSVNLSSSSDENLFAQLVTNENKVFVIWNDSSDGDNDVYLRQSDDYGFTFGPKINLSDDKTDSNIFILGPQISKSKNTLNVVWENKTDSSSNLILKQNPINSLSLSFSISDSTVQLSLEDYEIQPNKETQINLNFKDFQKDTYDPKPHSLLILDPENNVIFQSPSTKDVNGIANHTVIFPNPGQYSLKINFDNMTHPTDNEILITVIPEFGFTIFLILSIAISFAVFTKKIHPKMFR